MMNAGRTSGSKVVVMAVAGTVGMVGLGTVYLPFIADRDSMRGMDEDGGMDRKARKEMAAYLKKEGLPAGAGEDLEQKERKSAFKPGSMWSNMRK
jgi:hypothetical protein